MNEINFGRKIKELRVYNKLTQKQLAINANVSNIYLCAVENEKVKPSKSFVRRICDYFKVNYSQFFEQDYDGFVIYNNQKIYYKDEIEILDEELKAIEKLSQSNQPTKIVVEPYSTKRIMAHYQDCIHSLLGLQGYCYVICDNDSSKLHIAETVTFEANKEFTIKNTSKSKVELLWVRNSKSI